MRIRHFLSSMALNLADLLVWSIDNGKGAVKEDSYLLDLTLPDDLLALQRLDHFKHGIISEPNNYTVNIIVNNVDRIKRIIDNEKITFRQFIADTSRYNFNFKIFIQGNEALKFDIIARPKVNNFYIYAHVKGVLRNKARLIINTDTIPFTDVAKGYANFQERFILYDDAVLESTPEFSILPADIEQIHGMVVYSIDAKYAYYLQSRGFTIEDVQQLIGG